MPFLVPYCTACRLLPPFSSLSPQDAPDAVPLPALPGGYDIELQDVHFGYRSDDPILQVRQGTRSRQQRTARACHAV